MGITWHNLNIFYYIFSEYSGVLCADLAHFIASLFTLVSFVLFLLFFLSNFKAHYTLCG